MVGAGLVEEAPVARLLLLLLPGPLVDWGLDAGRGGQAGSPSPSSTTRVTNKLWNRSAGSTAHATAPTTTRQSQSQHGVGKRDARASGKHDADTDTKHTHTVRAQLLFDDTETRTTPAS